MELENKEAQKKLLVQVLVMIFVLILTLPLIYLLVSRVLLPLEWSDADLVTEERSEN